MKKKYISPILETFDINYETPIGFNPNSGKTDVSSGVTGEEYTDKPGVEKEPGDGSDLAKHGWFNWDDDL